MRCSAHCLVLLMAPLLANASTVMASEGRGDCVYSTPDAERPPTARSAAAAVPSTPKPVPAQATSSGGGGGEDDVLQRLRAPKWHSFLPGMFR
ncbi:hypothetical protein CXF96_10040 [Stenotrophomonas sp. Betaine-02u-21]|uniref:hypothetical protein n=1 Tax=unclassified Stenotrophomonas TaxID=196198 RepID=UPI000C341745|nr:MULTISPECIES: hypothetical protein [unclassified Stenotrophomonas]PKH72025.1 hypothetical protein CXF90_09250 [Stenotrophomonas sp. Betaine-02u-23]PKH73978.1 hypothetical protein CXF96_10040 [Stenotrophomonas sp. Betaine-02u-21]PKH96305.1 hypothetical protein CXG43_08285 [Stenotrophomonas sp. Bg11-02]